MSLRVFHDIQSTLISNMNAFFTVIIYEADYYFERATQQIYLKILALSTWMLFRSIYCLGKSNRHAIKKQVSREKSVLLPTICPEDSSSNFIYLPQTLQHINIMKRVKSILDMNARNWWDTQLVEKDVTPKPKPARFRHTKACLTTSRHQGLM